MNEQEDFFSSKHKQLLNIAVWAKYLAWVVLAVYILLSGSEIIKFQNFQRIICEIPRSLGLDIFSIPSFKLAINIAATILKGVVYYFVLKGVSLGLNMIVETDVNYREQKRQGGVL